MAYEDYCAACTYLGESCDYEGRYWCDRKGENRYASDSKCYNFCEAYSRSNYSRENMYENSARHTSSGCYLTTIMCKLLGYDDNNYYLKTLRDFRDNVMKHDRRYIPLLITYDLVGPAIAKSLENDPNGKKIATDCFIEYITPAIKAIHNDDTNTAINIYTAMTQKLGKRYSVDINIVNPDLEKIDMNYLGHGRARIKKPSNI